MSASLVEELKEVEQFVNLRLSLGFDFE